MTLLPFPKILLLLIAITASHTVTAQCNVALALQSSKTWVFQDEEKIRVGLKVKLFIDSATVKMTVEDPFKTDSITCAVKGTELCLWDAKNPFSTVIYLLEYREQKEDTFYMHPAKLVLEKRAAYRIKFMRSNIPDQYMEAEMVLLRQPAPKKKK